MSAARADARSLGQRARSMSDLGQSGASKPEPIKLPIPPGQAIWFDFISGKVDVAPIVNPPRQERP